MASPTNQISTDIFPAVQDPVNANASANQFAWRPNYAGTTRIAWRTAQHAEGQDALVAERLRDAVELKS
jgi:hypothetical protein